MTRNTVFLLSLIVSLTGCEPDHAVPDFGGQLPPGTWGGENVGVIVTASPAHVHVGCTNGTFLAPVTLRTARFEVEGSYVLRAFPVAVGPPLPARFTGTVSGNTMTFTVIVNDTVEKKT